MSINAPDPGESWEDFKARRAAYRQERRALGLDVMNPHSYAPIEPTRMVLTAWAMDEYGNVARQLRGV